MTRIVENCAALMAAIVSSGALMAGSAAAAPASQPARYTESLAVDDLDLTTDAGRATLEKRIKNAAHRVCAHGRDRFTVQDRTSARECEAQAIVKTREQARRLIERRVALR